MTQTEKTRLMTYVWGSYFSMKWACFIEVTKQSLKVDNCTLPVWPVWPVYGYISCCLSFIIWGKSKFKWSHGDGLWWNSLKASLWKHLPFCCCCLLKKDVFIGISQRLRGVVRAARKTEQKFLIVIEMYHRSNKKTEPFKVRNINTNLNLNCNRLARDR